MGHIVVEIPPKPSYFPRSRPPLEPVRLVPPRDSTAYIIERILLPPNGVSLKDDKPLPKRMTYIVGWRDLPAARLLIPAMKILDYVSPRELEDWEMRLEGELDEQRTQLEDEQKLQKSLGGKTNPVTGKRKRGRPPAHTQIEPGAVAELKTEGDAAARLKGGALSFSTPQKSRLKDFNDLLDDDASPSRQINKELYDYDRGSARYEDVGGEVSNDISEESEMDVDRGGFETEELPFDAGTDLQATAEGLSDWASSNDPLASNGTSGKHSLAPEKQPPPGAGSWAAFGFLKLPGMNMNGTGHRASAPASAPTTTGILSTQKNTTAGKTRLQSAPAAAAPTAEKKSSKKSKTTKPNDKGKEPQKASHPVDVNGEPVWVVERIEDYGIFEVEGQTELKKYFQVRWEGDWPPDQNPSWEPEENLPPDLVRNYFRNGKKKGRGKREWDDVVTKPPSAGPRKKKKMKQMTLTWTNGRQYSSVSEAFAGEDAANKGIVQGGDDPFNSIPHAHGRDKFLSPEGEGNDREEFFVVDDADITLQPQLDWGRAGS
jgi:hypothetical protein